MDFKTYSTPNGSTILCDMTNDFAYLLTDFAPLISPDNGIKVLSTKPSDMVGILDNYTLLEDGIGSFTASILQNIQVSIDQYSAALATYLLQFQV
jgi:hypothetical protein